MRLGLVSQWYDPEIGSAAVPGTIARALSDRDHDVQVLTGFPNYPSGRVYDGYRLRPYRREQRGTVTVHRAAIYPSHDGRPLHRAANYLSFAATASVVGARQLRDRDAVLVYSSPATAAIPAMCLRRLRHVPFVLQIQDIWPQSVTESGFLSTDRATRVARALERFCDASYRAAASIAVTSPGMADLVTGRGIEASKVHVVPNWVDESIFRVGDQRALADELGPMPPFTVMYAGNLGEMQGLDVIIDAASALVHEADIGFVLVGSGVAEGPMRATVAARRLPNVRFIPPQRPSRMADVLALGDLQVVSLKDTPTLRQTLPSKIQATLACGRPIVASVAGDAARLVEQSGSGVAVAPGDGAALAEAITRLHRLGPEHLAAMGAAGMRYYERELSQRRGAATLERLLSQAAHGGSR